MNTPAFTIGMFPKLSPTKLSTSSFTPTTPLSENKPLPATTITMVDPFQRKFQSPGRIGIDYSRPRKLASYVRSGSNAAMVSYPQLPIFSGFYSLSNCGMAGGSKKILMKADEFMAKNVVRQYKEFAVPNGEYSMKCAEGTTRLQAEEKRVFTRQNAFRQSQKPVNMRLREKYDARKKAFIAANGCNAEEEKFKQYPMSTRAYIASNNEAMGTCTRYVQPQSIAENYMTNSVMNQVRMAAVPYGEYTIGSCMEGHAKGQAEERRVAVLASEYRAGQQSASTTTRQNYAAPQAAIKYYGHECSHEESQYTEFPSVAAAMMRD